MRRQTQGNLHPRSGFTLIELILVLLVMAAVIGMSVPSARAFLKHQEIRDACKAIQTLASTAHKEAILNHKDHYIVLKSDGFALYSVDQPATPLAEMPIDPNLSYEIKLWPNAENQPPNNNRWFFSASGLVFPFMITVKLDDAWQSLEFDPLTGGILEEKYQFP